MEWSGSGCGVAKAFGKKISERYPVLKIFLVVSAGVLGDLCGQKLVTAEFAKKCRRER
jgi:hypothetical protein